MTGFSVVPEDGETDVLGKKVRDLQDNLVISSGQIHGILKYISDYTGYSNQPDEQSGNYMAVSFSGYPEGTKITVELTGSPKGPWVMKSNNLVARITDNKSQVFKVKAEKDGYEWSEEYSLANLVCEEE